MRTIFFFTLFIFSCHLLANDKLPSTIPELEKAALDGDSKALVQLGYKYFTGDGVDKDVVKAREYYLEATKYGESYAFNNLCNIYLYGEGVEVDYVVAFQYCREGAKLGNPSSMVMLGEMTANENGLFKDKRDIGMDLSYQFYEMAAKREHPHGQYMLGYYYENGIVTEKDLKVAKDWYTKAAEQNHISAKQAINRLKQLNH